MKMRSGTCHWTRYADSSTLPLWCRRRGACPYLHLQDQIHCSHPQPRELRQRKEKVSSFLILDYIEYDSSGDSKGALIKSIAQSKSHLFMLCEATNVTQGEKDFLYSRGWQTIQNNSGDIIIGSRTNLVGSQSYALSRLDTCRGSSCASATYLYDRRNHIW